MDCWKHQFDCERDACCDTELSELTAKLEKLKSIIDNPQDYINIEELKEGIHRIVSEAFYYDNRGYNSSWYVEHKLISILLQYIEFNKEI